MSFIKLQFKPGLNRDQTDYSNEGGWFECDKIRFRSGYPEKIGGWQRYTSSLFQGVCRQLWNWVTTYSDNLMALGTHQKVYIENGGYYNDITPLRPVNPTIDTPDTDNCIYTDTTAPNVVQIELPVAHEAETGDFVQISGVTGTIGGIPAAQINGNHEITVITGLTFTIPVTGPVTSNEITGAGGTSIVIDFEIRPGFPITTAGYGWGTGTWGRDAWGLGSDAPVFFQQRDWWFDNFDNDLVMNIRNGAGYWWTRGRWLIQARR
jgi:hypothetical protein